MYKGMRDDYVRIRVPQELCHPVILQSGEWIEIAIPDKITKDTWESWVVKPNQVFYDRQNPNKYNIIDKINDNTEIRISRKAIRDGKRVIIEDSEYIVSPTELIRYYENV